MTSAPAFEPSPFDEEDEGSTTARDERERNRRDQPFLPYTAEEFARVTKREPHTRMVDPWRCAYNLSAPDGIGHGFSPDTYSKYTFRQCPSKLADPTRSRYCVTHAPQMGVAFYSPDEAAGVVATEATQNLLRLVPKAIQTLDDVMDDEDAPPGIRAKAAESVLDRTGYGKGLEININAQVEVMDPAAVLRERLGHLRDAQMEAASRMMQEAIESTATAEVHDIEVVDDGAGDGPEPAPA